MAGAGAARSWTGRIARALFLTAIGVLLVATLAVGAALWLLHHLDSPAIRERIVRAVREDYGIEVDYDGVDLALSRGVTLRGVRVLTPEPFRPHAPILAGVDRAEVSWDVGSALSGPFRVTRVAVSGVRLTLVQDEAGRSSFQALLDAMPRPEREEPPARLSRGLPIGGLGVSVEGLEVRDVVLTRLVLRGGGVVRSETLEGIAVDGAMHSGSDPATASLTLRSPDGGPSRLTVREIGSEGEFRREVAVRHQTRIRVPDPLHVGIDMELSEVNQDFVRDIAWTGPLLDAGLAATFHPEESRIEVEMDRLIVGNGVARGTMRASYLEDADREVVARIEDVEVLLDLDRLPDFLRALAPSVRWKGGIARLSAAGIEVLTQAPWARVGGHVEASVHVEEVSGETGARRGTGRAVTASLKAIQARPGSVQAEVSFAFKRIQVRQPAQVVTLGDGTVVVEVGLEDLPKAISGAFSGTIGLEAGARMASVRTPAGRVRLGGIEVSASAPIAADPPFEAQGEARVFGVTWTPAGGEARNLPGGRLAWTLQDATPDRVAPARSTGRFALQAGVAGVSLDASLTKGEDSVLIAGTLSARSLALLQPFADHPALRDLRVPFGRLGLTVKTDGRVTGLAAEGGPHVDQRVAATLTGFQAVASGHRVEVATLSADLSATGRVHDLRARGTLEAAGARVDGRVSLRRVALTTEARLTASAPEARVSLAVTGRRGPLLDATAEAGVAGPERAVSWSGSVAVRAPSDLAPLLPPDLRSKVGLASLQAELETSGRVTGVLGRGRRLVSNPLDSARGRASFRARLRGLAYRSERLEVESPDLDASVEVERTGSLGAVRATLAYSSLRVDQRVRRFEVTGGSHRVVIEADAGPHLPARSAGEHVPVARANDGDLWRGEVTVAIEGTVARLAHDASARYPVERASLKTRARVSRLDAVRVDEFVLDNPAGGTRIEATAALDDLGGRLPTGAAAAWDLVVGHRSLAVTGTLDQRLDPLSRESFTASGTVKVPFRIQSGDRSLFRVAASIEAHGVRAEVPAARIAVRGLNGTIPIEEEVSLGPDGRPSLILETDHNLFSRVRFLDQHPFLRGGGFVAADRLVLGPLDVGPVAGNLRVLRNLVSLDQIEATWRDGKVSGQVIAEWHPGDPRVSFRGKVTGVRPSGSDERLDANAAIDFSLGRREVAGRIHFVRIGRGHLLDLMDAWDPYHENVSANRIRKALTYGYPKYARLRVNGGFLSAKVELGGLGSLVRIDEVRGIPTGPLLNRALGPAAH